MSKKVLVSLDMNKNEVQNVVMQSLATAPTSPKEGQYYYNSADGKAYQYVRTSEAGITPATYAWKPLGGAEITVDTALSSTSTNPVQNKAVKAALDGKANADNTISSITEERDSQTVSIMGFRADGLEHSSALVEKATQSLAGAMSAADKTKLDGIASGANKTVVDVSVTQNGNNPVTGKAIYDYVGDAIAASDAMVFKGTIGTGGTVTALPTTYKTGWTYRVITAGTYAGQKCEVGDLIIALVNRDGTGNLDSDWTVAQTNIDGAITNISATTPITVSGSGASRTIAHKASEAAGSYGEGSDKTVAFGDILSIPYISVDSTGHITGAEIDTITFPSDVATTKKAGLMSPTDKIHLNAAFASKIKVENSSILAGKTSCVIDSLGSLDIVVGLRAYMGHDEVVVDISNDRNGTITISIAQPVTTNIDVELTYI